MFGGNYCYPQYQQPQAQQQAQGAGNNMVWVQGLAGAKGYPVAAGSAVWMMDSEDKRFYLKSTDATGIPNPLRIFEYREGAGQVTLKGICNGCAQIARYKVLFIGNIFVPTGGTAGAISVALSIDGEALAQTVATVTPAAVGDAFNVATAALVDVPSGCCVKVAVENINTQAISVANANLLIERVA